MVWIYGLFTDQLCWYVGSTKNLKRRERTHQRKTDPGIGAGLIPKEYEWEFRILEECKDEERYRREGIYYESLKPLVNIKHPGQDKKTYDAVYRKNHKGVYYASHREECKKRQTSYNAIHRDERKKKAIAYYYAHRDEILKRKLEQRYLKKAQESYQASSGQNGHLEASQASGEAGQSPDMINTIVSSLPPDAPES